ncbi:hypothetical protein QBC35DRAFT_479716 [Podospora australis]|uniref:EF-hand domain-containing protein n=1 Tax=Podospora australis TaxID=1536484 RepID=A0AAN6X421_9PEZI|nr:hypothetical protein QBC35DRAFT_479716 [Podospora australis]
MAMPFKPSPLGYGSPRTSPFRRPQSPGSPNTLRQTTPSSSPTKPGPPSPGQFRTSRGYAMVEDAPEMSPPPAQPARLSPLPAMPAMAKPLSPKPVGHNSSAISHLQPSQVRTLREGFQILDRDSDGVVNREDVVDMLNQLGLPSHASEVTQFFPPSAPQTMTMAMFMNSISGSLAEMSPSSELLSAFSAFDDDDSGQVDLAELRDALLNTAPEPGQQPLTSLDVDKVIHGFTGRRAFTKSSKGGSGLGKRGEVFRYQDFVNSVIGGNNGSERASEDSEEA